MSDTNRNAILRRRLGNPGVIVVFGPTGNAGSGLLQAAVADPRVAEIRAVTRRPLTAAHPKLREVPCSDFVDLAAIADELCEVHCCLFCLGTSVRNVEGESQYRQIHVVYALAAARTLLAGSAGAGFVYLSGAGAKRTSRMMWARVKAEAEDALAELGLARLAAARPGGILPIAPTGFNRWLLRPLLRLVPALGIHAVDLGQAMLQVGLDDSWRGNRTLDNRELRTLAGR